MKKYITCFTLLLSFAVLSNAQSLQNIEAGVTIQNIYAQMTAVDDHCEVPCGIYNDSLRVLLMYEHASTIEKAMNQINEISGSAQPNHNQLIRWVMNKEKHAEEIQHLVSQYFLHQRIKPLKAGFGKKDEMKYFTELETLHQIAVFAMKTKQTTDLANVKAIRDAIHSFEHSYFDLDNNHHKNDA